ncbi:integrase catalytic domain-containing protein [Trichonephila clavipes]|uniref:Integrase catalytic domain-containing protein n=1 Tax=Trichonephila clavipes TaxID=2585209 RepID=A0A8X6WGE8_TRICX|nr:integrase catalytic domain-containing protein [Trichonephila clavipes]
MLVSGNTCLRKKNFADILSRGCSAQQLVYLRWWEGPSWLSESPVQCPRSKQVPDEEVVNLELRKSVLVNTAKRIEEFNWHSEYFSSYLKVVRMIAWIFRFLKNAKRIDVCNTSEITFSEFDHAEKTVIKLIQMEKFEGVSDEKLRPLKPFLDEFGILRARTKLSFREDTHNFKFPIILPNEHPVVHLMIVRKHEELMHAGVSIVMNHLRESFWILKARKLIRQIIQKCTRCKRFSAQKTEVVPSSLPIDRVSNSKIFQVVGVDLEGPLHLKDRRQLREQTQHHRKLRPLTVGEVVVVENSLKNRTLWSLARVIQLIPGKDGHVRVARVKTETGELVRPVQRLYNLELQEPETKLPKDLTDSVIRTRRGRKVISPKRLTYA